MNWQVFQDDFLRQLQGHRNFGVLFDYLPDVVFFVKNRESQFITGNSNFFKLLGVERESQVIGKTDLDFFQEEVGGRYIEEDRRVMEMKRPLPDRIWLVPNLTDNLLSWYVSTKVPLFDREGNVIGIAGAMRNFRVAGAVLEPYNEISEVLRYISENYAQPIEVPQLARMTGLSTSQFIRRFKKILQITPAKYITNIRLNAACRELTQTNKPLAQIARETGFCDHSYFTRTFTARIGMSPSTYRREHVKKTTRP